MSIGRQNNLKQTSAIKRIASSFVNDERGTFLPMASIILPVVMLASLSTMQYSGVQQAKGKVQSSVDAAVMAATIEANKIEDQTDTAAIVAKIQEEFEPFLNANLEGINANFTYETKSLTYNPDTKRINANVEFKFPSIVQQFTGESEYAYPVKSSVDLGSKKKTALSMFLVLDKSGSMGWDGRMTALKTAVNQLHLQFKADDPDRKYIRVGAVAYDSYVSSTLSPKWNPKKANDYTQALNAWGGTNSMHGMSVAYSQLSGQKEFNKHAKRNDSELKRAIVLMTDGVNNHHSYDTGTLTHCSQAKTEGIEVFTVAFTAPSAAQQLLSQCASSSAHYFNATSSQQLLDAFKAIGNAATKDLAFTE